MPDPRFVQLMANSTRVMLFTGAGISTASGIPDYRGPQGVWKRRQPVYYQDFLSSEAARIEYWNYKLEGRRTLLEAQPNAVHDAIARLERAGKFEGVVTQNIDGLHLAAGTSRNKLVELHGTDREVECQSCHRRTAPEPHFAQFSATGMPPRCEQCGGLVKPATISFGQALRQEDLERAAAMALRADLVVALGSTLSVTPAADIPLAAAEGGTPYVIVNRGETAHDDHRSVTLRLEGDVAAIFVPVVDAVCRTPMPSS